MYSKIKERLMESGVSEWQAGMTADHIDNVGAETVLIILKDLLQ